MMDKDLPILYSLMQYCEEDTLDLHVPGHKRGKLFDKIHFPLPENLWRLDTTEVPGIDNLHCPDAAIKDAEVLAAKAFGAKYTYFLVNGSSCGIEAMFLSCCNPGDVVLIPRNCHQSAIYGAIMADCKVHYMLPDYNDVYDLYGALSPETVKRELNRFPNAKAIYVTSPTYQGISSNLEQIAFLAHQYGALLFVDEAHGGHFCFHEGFPKSALSAGADLVVQSTHKTMGALTGGSMLHIGSERIPRTRLEQTLRMLQTSSPSHLILASLDMARYVMQYYGHELLDKLLVLCTYIRKEIDKIEGISCVHGENIDITRIVVNVKDIGISGVNCEKILREKYKIQVEMSDFYNLTAVISIADNAKRLHYFVNGLNQLVENSSRSPLFLEKIKYMLPIIRFTLREAFYASKKQVALAECVGKIAGEMITPYPPGIPLIMPGEEINQKIVNTIHFCLDNGISIHGSCMQDREILIIE